MTGKRAELVDVLKKFRLYEYVPNATGQWHDWSRGKTTTQISTAKTKWIAAGRVEPRGPKEGWLRFSFPHSYNSDLLEVLPLIGEAGDERDSTIDAGLNILASRRGRDGMWKMVGGLNGKMHAVLDAKGKPSPWITDRALLTFKRFGLLDIE
jgi:hypothetical protein